jgi:TonB family protein
MPHRDIAASIGVCASVAVHVGIALLVIMIFVRDFDAAGIHLPPLPGNHAARGENPLLVREDDDEFGAAKGRGYAINASPGDEILHARQGHQDQAWLSRDPVGPGKKMPEEPSMSTALPGMNGDGRQKGGSGAEAPSSLAPTPTQAAAPFGPSAASAQIVPAVIVRLPPIQKPEVIGIASAAAAPVEKPVAVAVMMPAVAPAPPQRSAAAASAKDGRTGGGSGPSGPKLEPADPAPQSESESDAFARIGSISFSGNKVEARLGREFKSVKPRLNLKAQVDLISLPNPRVLLKLSIDETGKITDVVILRSSGSNEIDLPTRLTMYKWWIEPAKDKNGKPAADVIVLAISYL